MFQGSATQSSKRFQIHPAGDANIRYVALVNNEGAAPIPRGRRRHRWHVEPEVFRQASR
jgi:hypothetical protein